jgi:hypothetical protein
MIRATPTPRSGVLGVAQLGCAGDAGHADAGATRDYTVSATPRTPQHRCPHLVTWLRCGHCYAGYFDPGTPAPHSCQGCGRGQLVPVGLWDLRSEAAPPGLLRRGEGQL